MDESAPQPVEQRFTVGEVSTQLGVPAHQLRRWCKYHAAHLSPEANPPQPGIERRLTAHDVSVLSSVRDMRAQGLTPVLINVQLGQLAIGEVVTDSQTAQDSPGGQIAPTVGADALASLQPVVDVLAKMPEVLTRIDSLESSRIKDRLRIEFLEAQRTKLDVVWIATATFIAGLIVGLAVWWFQ